MIAFPWTHGDTPPGTPTVKRRILRFVWRHLSSLTLFVLIADNRQVPGKLRALIAFLAKWAGSALN